MSDVVLTRALDGAMNRGEKKPPEQKKFSVRKPSDRKVSLPIQGNPVHSKRYHVRIEASEASMLYSAAKYAEVSSSEVGRFCVQELFARYTDADALRNAVRKYQQAQKEMHLSDEYEIRGYRPKYLADELTVRLSEGQAYRLDDLSKASGIGKSVLIRFAVYDTLRRYEREY